MKKMTEWEAAFLAAQKTNTKIGKEYRKLTDKAMRKVNNADLGATAYAIGLTDPKLIRQIRKSI